VKSYSFFISLVSMLVVLACAGAGSHSIVQASSSSSPATVLVSTDQSPIVVLIPDANVTLGQQIADCSTSLILLDGGICDARQFTGVQTADGFTVGAPGKRVQVLLNYVTLVSSGPIVVYDRSSISGPQGANGAGAVLQAAPGYKAAALVILSGSQASLHDLVLDGQKVIQNARTAGILIDAPRVDLTRVQVRDFTAQGVINSDNASNRTDNINRTCCAKLVDLESWFNGDAGLWINRSTDWFISRSEFEGNGTHGVVINGGAAMRIESSDFGGNAQNGLLITGAESGDHIITGNQFGQNKNHAIEITSPDSASGSNMITGNSFIPFGAVSQIEAMETAGHDSFTGNVFRNAVNCMHIAATSSSSGNICHLPPLAPGLVSGSVPGSVSSSDEPPAPPIRGRRPSHPVLNDLP
jgi:hypothetical protein